MDYSRREFGQLALTSVSAVGLPWARLAAQATKPNSKWAGVQVGMNVPYNFGTRTMPVDEVIGKTTALGTPWRSSECSVRAGFPFPPSEFARGCPVFIASAGSANASRIVTPAIPAAQRCRTTVLPQDSQPRL